ncbi:MAG: TonB-dependent receptor plug domain-containing protein, partial [Syntrophothermus sp.]
VPPGNYTLKASMIGYAASTVANARVYIGQTTEVNFEMNDQSIQTQEVVITAETPVVQKDVSSSVINLNAEQFQNMPIVNVASVLNLQAGIEPGLVIRGGDANQTAFMVNGLTLRDNRTGDPFMGVSMTGIEEVQVLTGGFNAEYGNVRSGVVNVVTREGKTDHYNVNFQGRMRPAGKKYFGNGPADPNSYWLRPYLDDAVAWTGTKNGAWDEFTQNQYQAFDGWNSVAQKLLTADPLHPLTPAAAQKLFLWQHRKDMRTLKPDYDFDMSLSGPVPVVSPLLGNLRFLASFKTAQTMYMIPLATDNYGFSTGQLKVTSDVAKAMKLSIEGLYSKEQGTTNSRSGLTTLFQTNGNIAAQMGGQITTADSRMFSDSYWSPADVERKMLGGKFTHALSASTFYEVSSQVYYTKYNTNPGRVRDNSLVYEIVPGYYYTNEAPFGWEAATAAGIGSSMRMGVGMSNSRDTSSFTTFSLKFDYTTQLDKYNNIKTGFDFLYADNNVKYGQYDQYLPSSNTWYHYNTFPIQTAVYVQDKIEYEQMVANIGVRLDYSNPNVDWYQVTNPYDPAFTSANASSFDNLLSKTRAKSELYISPRLGVAFPITETSKLFFNYGHFRQMPTPDNLYTLLRDSYDANRLSSISNPEIPLMKTVQYELGFEKSMMEEYLLRLAGYYKDVTNEPRDVTYQNGDGTIKYTVPEPDLYRDLRGFEVTLTKNRGAWVQGFINYTYEVNTRGNFNYSKYNSNPAVQREFIRTTLENDQTKPIPTPFARLNLDLFTPSEEFGPVVAGVGLLTNWRLNINASWRNGGYVTWTGGSGALQGVQNNVQWLDSWGTDIRVTKDFSFGPVVMSFFMDVYNVFNRKAIVNSSTYGFVDGNDYNLYMKSLHMPQNQVQDAFGYINIPGDDKPGLYRSAGKEYTPMIGAVSQASVGTIRPTAIYWFRESGKYMQYVNNNWVEVDNAKIQQIMDDKSYIDMPNMDYLSFLDPRNIFWGMKLSINL